MTLKFPCKIYEKPVARNHRAIQCDSCNLWIHIKCDQISPQSLKHLQSNNAKWCCIKCFANIIPSQSFQINSYLKLIKAKKVKFKAITKSLPIDHSLIDELNSAIDDTNNDLVASKYFGPNEISSLYPLFSFEYFFSTSPL